MAQIKYFYSILKNDIRGQKKTLIIWFMIIYVVLTLIPILWEYLSFERNNINPCCSPYNVNYIYFPLWLYLLGSIFASTTMVSINSSSKQNISLNVQVATLEKYVTHLFIIVVLFPVAFLVAFKFADYTRVAFFNIYYSANCYPISLVNAIRHCYNPVLEFSAGLFVQSIFILGSTIWRRKSFIKTVAIVFSLYITLVILETQFGGFISRIFNNMNWLIEILIFLSLSLINWKMGYSNFKINTNETEQ